MGSTHQIDFDKWTHEEDLSDEARDINDDFPGLYEKMQAEELGWPSKRESEEVEVWGNLNCRDKAALFCVVFSRSNIHLMYSY